MRILRRLIVVSHVCGSGGTTGKSIFMQDLLHIVIQRIGTLT